MSKKRECANCHQRIDTNNKGRISPHLRWDWPGWPSTEPMPKSHEMHEKRCEASDA